VALSVFARRRYHPTNRSNTFNRANALPVSLELLRTPLKEIKLMSEARMQETPDYAPGTFCWIELATSDNEAAKKFYTELFGWTFTDNPMGPDMVYTMLKKDDQEIGALYKMMPEMKERGIPPHWMSYAATPNADDAAAKAESLGGTIMQPPFDVMEHGRMAVIQDPTGAVFSLWQPKQHRGASLVNAPGSLCWNELMTTDTKKAGDFYSGLFGWGKDVQNFGPMEYTMFTNEGRPTSGMLQITPEMGPIPPNWLVYFAVDDCDATVQKASELGANVMKPADDIPGIGRFAILTDPQGAAFATIKLEAAPE
jgi:predicted enzyme related to lactoylglutathione lyase